VVQSGGTCCELLWGIFTPLHCWPCISALTTSFACVDAACWDGRAALLPCVS
jgi:hypothetical protein